MQKPVVRIREFLREKKLNGILIPRSDPHKSEYIARPYEVIKWISGFSGSAGTLFISLNDAFLWTDSRYFIQAEKELKSSGISLKKLKTPYAPEFIEWIAENMPSGAQIGINPELFTVSEIRDYKKSLNYKHIELIKVGKWEEDIWTDRPELPVQPVHEIELKYCGYSRKQKKQHIEKFLTDNNLDYQLMTSLDDIAWILNLRGKDIDYNPLFYAYLLISDNGSVLFTDSAKISDEISKKLQDDMIQIKPYHDIQKYFTDLSGNKKLAIDPKTTNFELYGVLSQNVSVIEKDSPVQVEKSIKNDVEILSLKRALVRECVSLVKLLFWLQNSQGKERISEMKVMDKLTEIRKKDVHYIGDSFLTISAFREHGAIVHYAASPDTDKPLNGDGLFLLDTGAHYKDGTTDITRTICLGTPTVQEMKDYTLVLKGHISLARAIFPEGTKGYQLDTLARKFLWEQEMNYGHGTGHGIGFYLNVHEGPQSISPRPVSVSIKPGMLISNEPGLYREGQHGIRIENMVLCREYGKTEFGTFFCFETVSIAPFDKKLINKKMLDNEEIRWINEYHKVVYERLSPHLPPEIKLWLKQQTDTL